MRFITALFLLAGFASAQPRMILTSSVITALKARATANTAEWQRLYGSTAIPYSCQWAVQTTAGTPDSLPPVYASRETTTYGTPTGYLRTGTDGAYYQGSAAAEAVLNLSICWLTLKDGDVDVSGSTAGTSDEVASAALYLTQAKKILDRFTVPNPTITVSPAPANWEGRTERPYWYVNGTTGRSVGTQCETGQEVSVQFYYHGLAAGTQFTFGDVPGLPALSNQTYRVAAGTNTATTGAPPSTSFYVETLAGEPVCASGDSTNVNHRILHDDGYPARFFVAAPALAYDWIKAELTTEAKSQVAEHMADWISEFKGFDLSIRLVQYEIRPVSNYHWGWYNSIGLAGIALYPDDARAAVWYDDWRNSWHLMRVQPFMRDWYGNYGTMMEGYRYLSNSLQFLTATIISNYTAMSDNLVTHSTQPFDLLLNSVKAIRHLVQPNGTQILDRGYIAAPNGQTQLPWSAGRLNTGAIMPVLWAADVFNHADKDKLRKWVADTRTTLDGLSGYPAAESMAWIDFVAWNPSGAQAAWEADSLDLPMLANPAGGYGMATMRSGWGASDVFAHFWPGPYISDPGNAKERWDKGSLTVQRGDTHLLVHASAECTRNFPTTYAGNETAYSTASACYNAVNNQGINISYYGGAIFSVWSPYKPGQPFGPAQTPPQGVHTQQGSWWTSQPGGWRAPDCMVAGEPYQKAPTYTVDAGTDTFTISPSGWSFADNHMAMITYGSGTTEGAPPAPLERGVGYFVVQKSGDTFKLSLTRGGTPINITSAGTGTQYIYVGQCGTAYQRQWGLDQPQRIDRWESGTGYAYARGTGLATALYYDPAYSTHYPATGWTREVLNLKPNLFVVRDWTQTANKTTASTRTLSGCTNATPVVCTATVNHGYPTGTQVAISGASVSALNGTWTITATSATAFSLDTSTASGASTGGTVTTNLIEYGQVVQWAVGRTPTASGSAWDIEDGATWKGRITRVLPANASSDTINLNSYGMLYLARSIIPPTTSPVGWLHVIDASSSEGASAAVSAPTSQSGVDAGVAGDQFVLFVQPTATFPVSACVPDGTYDVTIAGLPVSTTVWIRQQGGCVIADPTGYGLETTSSSAGLVRLSDFVVLDTTIEIGTTTLPDGATGTAYSQALSATGGTGSNQWIVASGSLPPGLTLSTGGTISGTPTLGGSYSFRVRVSDSGANTDEQDLSIDVTQTLAITTASLPAAMQYESYSTQLAAIGGTAPYTFALSVSTCSGLAISSGGAVTWANPGPAGTCSVTAIVTDSTDATDDETWTLTVSSNPSPPPAPTIGTPKVSGQYVAVNYGYAGLRNEITCTLSWTGGSYTDTGGAARRRAVLTLPASSTRTIVVNCGGPEASVEATTGAALSGTGTLEVAIGGSQWSDAMLQYSYNGTDWSDGAEQSCYSGCSWSISGVTKGLVYWRVLRRESGETRQTDVVRPAVVQ